MRTKYLIIFLIFCWTSCYGQFNFTTVDVNNGLSSNSVYNIFEDSKGYMWFATINGLNRYDGQRMRVFLPVKNDPKSISFSSIRCINEDKDGMIWIGGREGKLAKFNPQTDQFTEYEFDHFENSRVFSIWDILIDERNNKWIVTYDQIFILNSETGQIDNLVAVNKDSLSISNGSIHMFSIVQDDLDKNIFWAGTLSKYLLKINRITGQIKRFVTPEETPFTDIFQHGDDHLYATGYDGRILSFDKISEQWNTYQIPNETNSSGAQITAISDNELLVATRLVGLVKFNTKTKKLVQVPDYLGARDRLENHIIYSLFTDKNKNVWIGTQNDGLRVISNLSRRFHHWILPSSFYENHLNNISYKEAFVHDFYELDSTQILFTVAGFPHVFLSDHDFNNIEKIEMDRVVVEFKFFDFNNVAGVFGIWSNHGFIKIDLPNKKLIPSKYFDSFKDNDILARVSDTMNNKYWFASRSIDGCCSYDPVEDNLTFYKDDSNTGAFVNTQPKCYNGKVWFYNGKGLKSYDPISDQFYYIPGKKILKDLPYIRVHSIGFLNDSIMLIGGLGSGIIEYNVRRETLINRYLLTNGLLSNQVMRFYLDQDDRLFYTSYAGLGMINFKESKHVSYTEKSGLLDDYFNVGFQIRGNQYHIAGLGFFTRFNAEDFPSYLEDFKIRFESFDITNDTTIYNIDYDRNINLKPTQNFITIDYSVNNYFSDDEVSFEYQLSTVDDSLKRTTAFSLPYTNLSPGSYTFKIRIVSPRSNNSEFNTLNIIIAPYFYQTGWFKALTSLLILGLIYGIYRSRIALIKKEESTKRKLESKIKEIEMVALRSQMNPHFLFNSLNSIKSFIARQEPRKATNYLSKFAQLMRYILANSEHEVINLYQEVEAITLYMDLERMRFDKKFEYNVNVAESINLHTTAIPPLILQPYIENAIWHGLLPKQEKGNLIIDLYEEDAMLTISISDDGIGRAAAQELKKNEVRKRKSLGLRITSDRIKHYSSDSSVEIIDIAEPLSQISGTKVIIKFPFKPFKSK